MVAMEYNGKDNNIRDMKYLP